MPKRKHKKYAKPRKLYDKSRILEEGALVKKYGLKNKREIWKAESAIDKTRRQAKLLLTKSAEEQERFIKKLQKQGFSVKNIADILSLDKEDFLKRRLQSVIVNKGLANTPRQARQFIVHKHIAIDNKRINLPSYFVPVDEENKITLELVRKEKKPKENQKEIIDIEKIEETGGEDARE